MRGVLQPKKVIQLHRVAGTILNSLKQVMIKQLLPGKLLQVGAITLPKAGEAIQVPTIMLKSHLDLVALLKALISTLAPWI